MGRSGARRVNVWYVALLAVSMFACLERVRADFAWMSAAVASSEPLRGGWSKGSTDREAAALLDESNSRRILAVAGTYISYGALIARSVPCPPRSGRSYYTPNCRSATGPVLPYTRGCSAIARCARS